MSDRKFLTVMAVLDGKTQSKLCKIQNHLIENISSGTQTMGIPFHLTLGSYPTAQLENVIEKIKSVAENNESFDVNFVGYGKFSNKVFFLEPQIPQELLELRKHFECDYANGFKWVPHATLFCGEEDEVIKAEQIAPELDFPIIARIVGIELGEFFPAEKKFSIDFK